MADTAQSGTAGTLLYIVAIVMAVYGIGFLLFPDVLFDHSQDPGVPSNPGWVRWGGGLLLGSALAAWLAASRPEAQRPLLLGLALAFTLIALSMLYSLLVGDYRGVVTLSWVQILVSAAIAAGLWWVAFSRG